MHCKLYLNILYFAKFICTAFFLVTLAFCISFDFYSHILLSAIFIDALSIGLQIFRYWCSVGLRYYSKAERLNIINNG